jgi:hypothetical protein
MTAQTISAKLGTEENSPSATVNYDFGDNLGEATALFGDDVVYSRFKAAAVVDLQALIRRHLDSETPKSESEIQALVSEWRPGVTSRKRKSTKEKAEELFTQLSDADKKALLEQLMNQAA